MPSRKTTPIDKFLSEDDAKETPKPSKNGIDPLLEKIQELVKVFANESGHSYRAQIGRYRASSVPYCNRKIAFEMLLGVEELEELEEDTRLVGTAMTGQIIHDFLEKALEPILISSEEEVEVNLGEFVISGHYDLLVKDVDGNKIVIDVKTCSDASKVQAKEAHVRQLSVYQAALGGIDGALLYVERNNFQMKMFRFPFDKEIFSQVVVKMTELHSRITRTWEYFEKKQREGMPQLIGLTLDQVLEAVKLDLVPPREPEFEYECRNAWSRCRFYDICYSSNSRYGR